MRIGSLFYSESGYMTLKDDVLIIVINISQVLKQMIGTQYDRIRILIVAGK